MLELKEKQTPKEFKATLPEELYKVVELYIQDAMKASNYPESAANEARDQVAAAAFARIITSDKEFAEKRAESAAIARKYLLSTKKSEQKEDPGKR